MTPRIVGIVNLTADSFSDGGRFLDPRAAIEQGRRLAAEGAALVELGAESTHPDAADVSADEELRRLAPVVEALKADGLRVAVDTYKPAVMREMLTLGVDMINDVTGLADGEARKLLRDRDIPIVIMHSRAPGARAERRDLSPEQALEAVRAFFTERIAELVAAGIARGRLILDPGMGFFLSTNPHASVTVLRKLPLLREFGLPLYVSVSRKSFFVALLEEQGFEPPEPQSRGPATLAAELHAARHGADYIRTHDVAGLRQALVIDRALNP